MSRLWKYEKPVTEEQILAHPFGPGKVKLSIAILDLLKKKKQLEESKIRIEVYQHASVLKALYLLRVLGALSSEGSNKPKKIDTDSLLKFESVKTWIDSLKAGPEGQLSQGQVSSLYTMNRYLQYLKEHSQFKDPDQLIEDALDATRRRLRTHIQLQKDFVKFLPDVDNGTRSKVYNTLRSFYLHNDAGLPYNPLNLSSSENHLVRKDRKDTKIFAQVRQILKLASPRDAAIILSTMQAAVDESTLTECFNFLAYSQLTEQLGKDWREWDPSKAPIQIWLYRPKTIRTVQDKDSQYYTFLDVDAIQALKTWLAVRYNLIGRDIELEKNGREDHIPRSEPIFITEKFHEPIAAGLVGKVFRDLAKKTGINIKPDRKLEEFRGARIRYHFHAHEVRDSLKTLARPLGLSNEVEFFLGHSIDKLHYDKSPEANFEYWRDIYKRFSPYLNVISNDPDRAELASKLEVRTKEKDQLEGQLFVRSKMLEEKIDTKDKQIDFLMSELQAQKQRLDQIEKIERERKQTQSVVT